MRLRAAAAGAIKFQTLEFDFLQYSLGLGGMYPGAARGAFRRWRRFGSALLLTALLLTALLAPASPAAAQEIQDEMPAAAQASGTPPGHACDPSVRQALAESAAFGVEQELAVIRNADQGIRDPDSIFDFSCIADLFDYRAVNIQFDPGQALDEILGLLRRRVCAAARDAYAGYVGREIDATVYTARIPRLPGLDVEAGGGNVLDDAGVGQDRFRKAIGQ